MERVEVTMRQIPLMMILVKIKVLEMVHHTAQDAGETFHAACQANSPYLAIPPLGEDVQKFPESQALLVSQRVLPKVLQAYGNHPHKQRRRQLRHTPPLLLSNPPCLD
jgi:hypothetical protein